MQVVQLLGGADGRGAAMLDAPVHHLEPGGALAVALADPFEAVPAAEPLPPLPDVREQDGWVLSSQPVAVRPEHATVAIDRLRQRVSPSGRALRGAVHGPARHACSADELEAEAAAAGLAPAPRRTVPATPDHVGSTVVICEAAA